MSRSARVGQIVLTLFGALSAVFASSVYASPDPFDGEANALIATFGVGFGALVVLLALAGLPSRSAWAALWVVPAFLLSHVVLLGTALPDLPLAAVTVVALILTRPTDRVYQSPASSAASAPSSSRTMA